MGLKPSELRRQGYERALEQQDEDSTSALKMEKSNLEKSLKGLEEKERRLEWREKMVEDREKKIASRKKEKDLERRIERERFIENMRRIREYLEEIKETKKQLELLNGEKKRSLEEKCKQLELKEKQLEEQSKKAQEKEKELELKEKQLEELRNELELKERTSYYEEPPDKPKKGRGKKRPRREGFDHEIAPGDDPAADENQMQPTPVPEGSNITSSRNSSTPGNPYGLRDTFKKPRYNHWPDSYYLYGRIF